jgi:hypothetical protein
VGVKFVLISIEIIDSGINENQPSLLDAHVVVDEISANPKNDLREIVHWINIDLLKHLLLFLPHILSLEIKNDMYKGYQS